MPGLLTPCLSGWLGLVLQTVAVPPAPVTSLSGRVLDGAAPVADAVVFLEPEPALWAFPELTLPESDLDRLPPVRPRPAGRMYLVAEDTLLPRVLVVAPGEPVGLLRTTGSATAEAPVEPPQLCALG